MFSAVVVSYYTGPILLQSLRALADAEGVAEIVLVDNGNPEDARGAVREFAKAEPRLRFVQSPENVGFAAGCNLGAQHASQEALLFVNPDALLTKQAPAKLLETLNQISSLAIVGGDLRDLDGRPDRGSRRAKLTLWSAFVSFSGLSRFGRLIPWFRDLHLHNEALPAAPVRMDVISGALMAIRASDFASIGGFDAGYFLHVEDIDICRRVEEAGGQVWFMPGPHGTHHRSSSDVSGAVVAQHKARGFGRYFRKFARSWWDRVLAEMAAGALVLMAPRGQART